MNHLGLCAFYFSALKENMTEAALVLGVTQSALSQRISTLEDELEATLFVRDGKTLKLTPAGIELLKYCHHQWSLENEFLAKLKSDEGELAGSLRVGSYSSILRSVILPGLAPLLRAHPRVRPEFKAYEMGELEAALKMGKVDLIIMDGPLAKKGILEFQVGVEEYVVIESVKFKPPQDVYLDHGPEDKASASFFELQGHSPTSYTRSFMGDVYGVIDGVELGLGRAVMSQHLIRHNKKIKVVSGFKKYHRRVTAHYFERPYYPKLLQRLISELQKTGLNL